VDQVEKQKHIVEIGGKSYSLISTHSPAHVERILHLLNTRLRDFSSVSSLKNHETTIVLSALSLADELISAQDDNTRLRRDLQEAYEKIKR